MARRKEDKIKDKGVYIPPELREPYAPENIRLSKAEFIEKQRIKRERQLKIKEYESKLRNEGIDSKVEESVGSGNEEDVELSVIAKPRGRPKKIEG